MNPFTGEPLNVTPEKQIKRLRQRIEELEKKQKTIDVIDHIGLGTAHIITAEQIDAVWRLAVTEKKTFGTERMFIALDELGVVRCENPLCDNGEYPCQGEGNYSESCLDCDGHGWIIKNDRTEGDDSNGKRE